MAIGQQPLDHTHDPAIIGGNLRRLRQRDNLSLESLARRSGVSRGMLGQIEQGHSSPTIRILWRIASAFGVPISTFLASEEEAEVSILRPEAGKLLRSRDGSFSSRALFPTGAARKVEFYELRLEAGCIEPSEGHPPGTVENLVVSSGSLEVAVNGDAFGLNAGDAACFAADVPHVYLNPGEVTAVVYLVMSYPPEHTHYA